MRRRRWPITWPRTSSRRSASGQLALAAWREGSRLVLSVTDDGPGLPAEGPLPGRSGVGLANTRGRLQQLYGSEGVLELRSARSGGVEARVELPFRLAPSEVPAEPAVAQSPVVVTAAPVASH